MMTPSLEETITVDFVTSNASTGAAADADSTPTVEVFEDATDTAILTPTAVKRTDKTGNYRVPVACTAANGFEAGKSYNVVASATVNSVDGKGVVERFVMRTRDVDDIPTSAQLVAALPTAAEVALALASASVATTAVVGDLQVVMTLDGTPYSQSAAEIVLDQSATVDVQLDVELNDAALDMSSYTGFTLKGVDADGTALFEIAHASFGTGSAATGTVTCSITAAHTATATNNGRLEFRFTDGSDDYRAKWPRLKIKRSELPT